MYTGTRSLRARAGWQTANSASGLGFAKCRADPWSTWASPQTSWAYRLEPWRSATTTGETEG